MAQTLAVPARTACRRHCVQRGDSERHHYGMVFRGAGERGLRNRPGRVARPRARQRRDIHARPRVPPAQADPARSAGGTELCRSDGAARRSGKGHQMFPQRYDQRRLLWRLPRSPKRTPADTRPRRPLHQRSDPRASCATGNAARPMPNASWSPWALLCATRSRTARPRSRAPCSPTRSGVYESGQLRIRLVAFAPESKPSSVARRHALSTRYLHRPRPPPGALDGRGA